KIDEHAVAHVLRYEAAEAAHSLRDALLIGRNDLAQILRVHPGGERRRPDKIREHHRDLTTFGGVLARGLHVGGWLRGHWSGRPHFLTNGCEHLPPMPERNTDFPEVLIC